MPSKSFLVVAASIAFLCITATSHAQSSPFANCPNCQLKAAGTQTATNVYQAQPTFTPQRYAAPVQMAQQIQAARPIQHATQLQYPAPQFSNYAPAVVARPAYSVPVYRAQAYQAPVHQAPVQAYRPVYRNYAPTIHSGCGGY